MEIVIICANEAKAKLIRESVAAVAPCALVESFSDAMLAVKRLYASRADMVFIDDTKQKILSTRSIVNLLRAKQHSLDISVFATATEKDSVLRAGADRAITEEATRPLIQGIVSGYKTAVAIV